MANCHIIKLIKNFIKKAITVDDHDHDNDNEDDVEYNNDPVVLW